MAQEVFELTDGQADKAVIRVIGVGGGGCNTVNQMAQAGIEEVEFVCANTDKQHLERCNTSAVLQLGAGVTRGLGAGSDPSKGREAALEDKDRLRDLIEGTDMLFITAGMGGGTGTGAAPVIAEIARELEVLTVAVVTKPFVTEGKKRMAAALKGIAELEKYVDSLIIIPNEKVLLVMGEDAAVTESFKVANEVLQNAVQGISDLITRPGLMNVDFADVKTVMQNRGKAMMGLGRGRGDTRARDAVEMALSSPLLDDIELSNAQGILINIACDSSLKNKELHQITQRVMEIASEEADVKFGTSLDPTLEGELRVSVVATGLGALKAAQAVVEPQKVVPIQQPIKPKSWNQIAEEPAVNRMKQTKRTPEGLKELVYDEAIIDIPAFLRAQAD